MKRHELSVLIIAKDNNHLANIEELLDYVGISNQTLRDIRININNQRDKYKSIKYNVIIGDISTAIITDNNSNIYINMPLRISEDIYFNNLFKLMGYLEAKCKK